MADGDRLLGRFNAKQHGRVLYDPTDTNVTVDLATDYLEPYTEITTVNGKKVIAPQVVVTTAAGTSSTFTVSGNTITSAVSLTRPADLIAYSANDVISNSTSAPALLNFSNLARIANGSGYIVNARIITNTTGITPRLRLQLYRNNTPSAINDNAQFTLLYANASHRIGVIDFAALATEGTGSDSVRSQNTDIRLAFAGTTNANIYGILQTLDGFTPTSGQQFTITLTAEVN